MVSPMAHDLQNYWELPRIQLGSGNLSPLPGNVFSSRLKKSLHLVRLVTDNKYYFLVADRSVIESLALIYLNLPGEKSDCVNSHDLIARIIKTIVEIQNGNQEVSDPLRMKVREHLAYHEPKINEHTRTPLDDFADGLSLHSPRTEDLRAIEISVSELLYHVVAGSGFLGADAELPNERHHGTLGEGACYTLRERGLTLVPGPIEIGSQARFEPTCAVTTHITGFSGKLGAFSFSNAALPDRVSVIGRYCSIAEAVIFGAAEHPLDRITTSPFTYDRDWIFGAHLQRTGTSFESYCEPKREKRQDSISIGNDVWIGRNVYIRGGVTIGDGAVIGTGSVVTRDVGPYEIVAGVPARLIRLRFSHRICERLIASAWWNYAFPDMDGLSFDNPDAFLAGLERRVESGACKPYSCKPITGEEISKLLVNHAS